MTKKYQICHHHIRFFKLKMHHFGLGELTMLPRPPSRLGRGIQNPGYASFLRPPQHKILATPVRRETDWRTDKHTVTCASEKKRF